MNQNDDFGQGGGKPSNPIGIVGFVLAFCLSPIGLIISIVGLAKEPRGFAIAGVFVGLIGSVIWGILGFGIWMVGPIAMQIAEVVTDREEIGAAIARYQANNDGAMPDDLAALNLPAGVEMDPWGTEYRFEGRDDGSWALIVAGPDGGFDDGEDAVLESSMGPNEAGNVLGDTFGETLGRDRLGGP